MSARCECGLVYLPDHPPDVRYHRRVHDAWEHGVKIGPLQSDRVVAHRAGIEVLVVAPDAPRAQRHRARLVGSTANKETHYDFGVYSEYMRHERGYSTHVFLARETDRAVGVVVTRARGSFSRTTWSDDGTPDDSAARPCDTGDRWTVDFAWTHRRHRRRGIATLLIRTAASHFAVHVHDLAWGAPFEPGGEALARQLCPEVLYLAAD